MDRRCVNREVGDNRFPNLKFKAVDDPNSTLFNIIPGYWQAQLLATMGMAALPTTFGESESPTIK